MIARHPGFSPLASALTSPLIHFPDQSNYHPQKNVNRRIGPDHNPMISKAPMHNRR
jgi:hypothetical protein